MSDTSKSVPVRIEPPTLAERLLRLADQLESEARMHGPSQDGRAVAAARICQQVAEAEADSVRIRLAPPTTITIEGSPDSGNPALWRWVSKPAKY